MLEEIGNYFEQNTSDSCKITKRYENQLWFTLQQQAGRAWAHKIYVDISQVDRFICKVIWDLAQIGDMAIVTHKPKGIQTILTHPKQKECFPRNWSQSPDFCITCADSTQMESALRHHIELDLPDGKRALFGPDTPIPMPGTIPDLRETVYVELLTKHKDPARQWRLLMKFLERFHQTCSAAVARCPANTTLSELRIATSFLITL